MNIVRMKLREMLKEYNIEIPMLQRDYAQGRVSQSKVANEFLDSIFNVLSGKNESLHIDFIYGYQENNKFLLIDGQQRITTLWLLHFYLYKKANRLEEVKDLLKNFSYNTRKSSKNFCKALLEKEKDFNIDRRPSEAIDSKEGVFGLKENRKNDPTIKAMLNMLDLIFEKVREQKDIKKLANNLDKITFDLFDMKKFELGEELYIKMNARGKQLSKYENLKSFIEKGDKISKEVELLVRIDNRWSDYFWSGNSEFFDKRGRNFLHYATLFFKLEKLDSKNTEKEKEIIDNINKLNRAVDKFYEPLQDINNIKLLDRVVELCMLFDNFKISESLKLENSSFFDKDLSYPNICYFFSILCFVDKNKEVENIDKNAFNDYLRVCRHFIENHRLDEAEEHISSFFKLFKHLSQGYNNIYQFLRDNSTYSFHSNIYGLEVRKAELILNSRNGGENWEDILNKTSDHKILKGWVDFLLDFSDDNFIYEKYNEGSKNFKKPNLKKFIEYALLTIQILDKIDKNKNLKENLTLFQRAFLCIGDFSFYTTNWFYGNSPTDIFRDREAFNWILKGSKNSEKLPHFKKFLDKLLTLTSQGKDLVGSMQEIINQTDLIQKEWWEQLLIREEYLFGFLDETKDSRIRYFDKKGNQLRNSLKNVTKVEFLPHKKNTTNVKDCLDYGFYCYCDKIKRREVSEYQCDEEQYGKKFKLQSHFSLKGVKVLCDSMESIINFGDDKKYPIKLEKGTDIFSEFDKILKLIDEDKNTQ